MQGNVHSHKLFLKGDTRYSGPLAANNAHFVKMTAIMVCIYLKCYASQLSPAQYNQLVDLIGSDIEAKIESYLKKYKTHEEALSPSAASDRDELYSMWDTSFDNLQKLKSIIEQIPLCIVLPDCYCKAPNGVTITVHTKTFHEVSTQLTDKQLLDLNITEVETVHVSGKFIAVSELAWNVLSTMMLRTPAHEVEAAADEKCKVGCVIS